MNSTFLPPAIRVLGSALLLALTVPPASATDVSATPVAGTYRDAALPVDRRVDDLLRRMSLDEKVGQLAQRIYGWECYRRDGDRIELTPKLAEEIQRFHGMGHLYGFLRADPWSGVTWQNGIPPERRVEMVNKLQKLVIENNRWGIPALLSTEASHGYFALGGTILPTAIGLGSTWNPDLYQEAAHGIAAEIRASGEHLVMVSCLDVNRDPRWGRTEETFGEDPVLVGAMARAATLGMQGENPAELARPDRAVIILKHFAGQGAAAGGHNAAAAAIGPRELREIHLPPAEAGVRAGALSVMAAYNEVDGIRCCANPELLTKILRGEWGFTGAVMADGAALDIIKKQQAGTDAAAGALAVHAGVDLGLWDEAFASLGEAVAQGRVAEADVDRAVARVLRLKFQLGLFDHPYLEANPAALAAAQAATRQANAKLARESLVLLKNDGGVLPFRKGLKRVAVIGPNADNAYAQLGDYTPPLRGDECSTVLAGVRELLGRDTEVVYAQGCDNRGGDRAGLPAAVAAARSADATILVLGGSSNRYAGTPYTYTGAASVEGAAHEMDCGEGVDMAKLELDPVQLELVAAIRATGVPLAVVLIQGRPHTLAGIADTCPAILCAWYPGHEGGRAVAAALFGDVNPSGRLPISIPRSVAQLPSYYNYKAKGNEAYVDLKGAALYPFGYGLSYTRFSVSNLQLSATQLPARELEAGANVTVAVDVRNDGPRAGAETIQLYLHRIEAPVAPRVRELKAFTKVELQPGEVRTVHFNLTREQLGLWGPDLTFAALPGLNEVVIQGGDTAPVSSRIRVD